MEQRSFGPLGEISALTLGGGGIGQVWGPTTREEAIATVHAAVEGGIAFLDLAPGYGDGEAERVVGEAFGGSLPDGVRVSTKFLLGRPPAAEVYDDLAQSLTASLGRMRLQRADLLVLHGMTVPDGWQPTSDQWRNTTDRDAMRRSGTPRSLFVEAVRPAFERLLAGGRIGAWAITGIGIPSAVIETLEDEPPPAAVQCIANLLDSPGALGRYEKAPRPRELIAAAARRGVGVMGIRAVQAGALTDALDRQLPDDHPEMADYRRAEPFREIAREAGESPAALAHRYSLSMDDISTVVLGVKNRDELRECLEAEARGPLDAELIARIDAAVGRE